MNFSNYFVYDDLGQYLMHASGILEVYTFDGSCLTQTILHLINS